MVADGCAAGGDIDLCGENQRICQRIFPTGNLVLYGLDDIFISGGVKIRPILIYINGGGRKLWQWLPMTSYDSAIIEKYATNAPRYTSYPTAPHFSDKVGQDHYRKWLGAIKPGTAISLYIHIPFCDRLCWFCGCHTKHTLKYQPVVDYLEVLYREIGLIGEIIGKHGLINQLHLGGGSPSMLLPKDLRQLKRRLKTHFHFAPDAEISVELDPSDIDDNIIGGLAEFGMTRASIGVQDFSPYVQAAINRPQSFEDTQEVVRKLRQIGINSLNIDALYGLPLQTRSGLRNTLKQVLSLDADRIALFGYAHVPWMKKHQQMIDETTIPGLTARFSQARMAEAYLVEKGYRRIGIDHFARHDDGMAIAHRQRTLKRNFQGYTTDNAQYLIGLGASSIGKTPQGFVQNTHATAQYMGQVTDGQLPIARGFSLSETDKMQAAVIEQLMCYFQIGKPWLVDNFGKEAKKIEETARALTARSNEYFIETENGYEISEAGRPFTRQFCAQFDEYLNKGAARYSVGI